MVKLRVILPGLLLAAMLGGCQSNIQPMLPLQQVEVWEVDAGAATGPATTQAEAAATEPATQLATTQGSETQVAATQAETVPATQPGRMVVRTVDPNKTAKFVYNATYDNIWRQASAVLTKAGFMLDRQDYRLGEIVTRPLASSQIVEFWQPQHAHVVDALENTINNQRRIVRLTIANVPGKPDFYEIGVQVLVERESNPTEVIGGPIFVEGSGFGRNAVTLRSDFAEPDVPAGRWWVIGHDPNLEGKLLKALFERI